MSKLSGSGSSPDMKEKLFAVLRRYFFQSLSNPLSASPSKESQFPGTVVYRLGVMGIQWTEIPEDLQNLLYRSFFYGWKDFQIKTWAKALHG
jgi:hypothetical protein